MKIPQQLLDSMEAKNLDHVYQHLDRLETILIEANRKSKDANKKLEYSNQAIELMAKHIIANYNLHVDRNKQIKKLTKIVLVGLIILITNTLFNEYREILQTMWETGADTLKLWF